jgi:hypothetical protein
MMMDVSRGIGAEVNACKHFLFFLFCDDKLAKNEARVPKRAKSANLGANPDRLVGQVVANKQK